MKPLKSPPGHFLAIDDLYGDRTVVLVAKDGVTFWDTLDADAATPLTLHPVFKHEDLGTLVGFAHGAGLGQSLPVIIQFLRSHAQDPNLLRVMRMTWSLAKAGVKTPRETDLAGAWTRVQLQERRAAQIQGHAERYCALAASA